MRPAAPVAPAGPAGSAGSAGPVSAALFSAADSGADSFTRTGIQVQSRYISSNEYHTDGKGFSGGYSRSRKSLMSER